MTIPGNIDISNWKRYSSSPILRGSDPFGLNQLVDWMQLYSDALSANNTGDTYWVATDGSNGNGGFSKGDAFADIIFALGQMSGGDELIIADGTYTDNINMRANDNTGPGAGVTIPNGISHTQRTIIRAETPFKVIIEFNSSSTDLTAEGAPFRLETAEWIWIDGIIGRMFGDYSSNSGDPPTIFWVNSPHNTVTRCIGRKNTNTNFGGCFSMTGDDLLFQDSGWGGATRYGTQYGGGLSSTQQESIGRRIIGKLDFDNNGDIAVSPQPHASFAYYGSSSNANGQHEHQNCFALNGRRPIEFSNATDVYGGIYNTHRPTDVITRGCGVIDVSARFGGIYTGEFGADLMGVIDCLILDPGTNSASPSGLTAASSVTNQTNSFLTIGGYGEAVNEPNVSTPTNSRLLTGSEPAFNPLLRDAGDGCEIIYAIGPFMSRYGDTDYNVPQTNLPLWPYPFEDEIATELRIAMATPTNYTPLNNDSDRGAFDPSTTISKYIIEIRGADYETELAVMYE